MKKMHLKVKKNFFKLFLFILTILASYLISLKYILNDNNITSDNYIDLITDASFNNDIKYKYIFDESVKLLSKIDIKKPETILTFDTFDLVEEKEKNKNIIKKEVYKEEKKEPIVYIYNSHQHETYSNGEKIITASLFLKQKLEEQGIESLVEETSVEDTINLTGISYNKYYGTTRNFINNTKNQYKSIKYFIDIHRDGIKKSSSTISINGINYAKLLFVIAESNPNYKENEYEATKLSNIINNSYNNLSRGIFKRTDEITTLYNQDISKYVFLIEIGGNENTFEEVTNTVEALSESLTKYIKEDN